MIAIRKSACLLALALLTGTLSAGADGATAPPDLSEISQRVAAGRLQEAEADLVALLDREETAAGRDLLGVLQVRLGRFDEAERQFVRAVEIDPELPEPRQHLARVLLRKQRVEEAMAQLRAAARSGPLERELALRLAAAEIAQGNLPAAKKQLMSVIERFDSVKALLDLARLEARSGEQDEANRHLVRALELAPNSEEVLSAFARLSLARRTPVPAMRALEPLTRMHPEVADYAYLLGVAKLQIGENEGAAQSIERALELEPDRPQALTALGLAFNSGKRFAEAKKALQRSLEITPASIEALAALAEAEEGLGEYEAAENHARETLALRPTHAGAHLVLGKVRMNQQRYSEAKDSLVEALAADPSSPKAHYQLSLAYSRLGDREASKRHLEHYRRTQREAEEYVIELRTQAGLGVSGMKR